MYMDKTPDLKPEEIIDYLRKSRSDDPLLTVEEVLQKHEEMLDEWSLKHIGAVTPENNKYREVVSGETLKERPQINIVLRRIESPGIKAIKIIEPQRLTRGDLEDIGRVMKLLKHTNTLVITLQRTYDLRDEYDWDAFERELKRGNDYLEYTKKILNRGRLLSVSQGNYVGNTPPYGYDKTFITEGKRKCPILVPNAHEAEVVRMIFDMYVNQDMGCTNICHKLDSMGIKPRKGNHWSAAAMTKMLQNIHYTGKVTWNHRKTQTIVEDGEFIKTRPVSKVGEYFIYDGKHEAIISDELFQAAQEKKGRNARIKPNTKVRNPLAGLLWCQCGRAMSLRTYKFRDAEPRLLCDDQVHCGTGSCLYSEMIDRVCDILEKCIEDFEVRIQNNEGDSIKMHSKMIESLKKRLSELEEKELAQWEQQSHPDPAQRMPAHIFKQLNERLLKEKEEVQEALCNAYESMPAPVDYEEKVIRFREALDALRNPDVSAADKNRMLKACIERIEYHRDKPERIRSTAKRVTVNGKRIKPDGLKTGANWTNPPIELDVKLMV